MTTGHPKVVWMLEHGRHNGMGDDKLMENQGRFNNLLSAESMYCLWEVNDRSCLMGVNMCSLCLVRHIVMLISSTISSYLDTKVTLARLGLSS